MSKPHNTLTLDPAKRTIPLLFAAALLALAAFQHMIVLYVVFPALDSNLLRWVVPSRYGNGTDTLLDTGEFATLSFSFMAVMGALFILMALFIKFEKYLGAFLSFLGIAAASLLLFPLTFGNVFGDLWNVWAAVIGVILAFGVVLVCEIPVFSSFKYRK